MRVTRRFWGVAAAGGVLAGLAALFATPAPLLGAVGVGAWVLARQYAFLAGLRTVDDALVVTQTLSSTHAATEERIQLGLRADLDVSNPLPVTVDSNPPLTANGGNVTISLGGETDAKGETSVAVSVAGRHRFATPSVQVHSRFGLFAEDIERGEAATLTVQPRTPRDVHVGAGGDRFLTTYGQHTAEQGSGGIDPAEVREYRPGDPLGDMDWKATARLGEPYIREFEVESDRRTVLLVDHSAQMATGDEGETQLDYVREVALAMVDAADERDDPLGLYTVGDAGLTNAFEPAASGDQYERVREQLRDLEPTADTGERERSGTNDDRSAANRRVGNPARAHHVAAQLAAEDTPFAARVRPFVAAGDRYVRRIEDRPLFTTARTYFTRTRGQQFTILLTDDSDRTVVRETVKLLRRGNNRALAVLAPDALFAAGGIADLERAYGRYVDFEEFRRDLAALDRVTALEVAPGDRVAAVLAAGHERRSRRRSTTQNHTSRALTADADPEAIGGESS